MRVALIEQNIVVNIVDSESVPNDAFGADLAVASDIAQIGDTYDDGEFLHPTPVSGTPTAVTPPIFVSEVGPYQARVALLRSGLLDEVEALMANPTTDAEIVIAWEKATVFKRNSTMIIGMGAALGLTEQQLDDLFVLAATIE